MKYVHVFPHSHTDLGWLGTIDEYFKGENLDLYIGGMKQMFDTVTASLIQNP